MTKTLWFDMDGTLYNLYKIPGWLDALLENDMTIFSADDMGRKSLPLIREAVRALTSAGWNVGVITWAPKDVHFGTKPYLSCFSEKINWLRRNFPELVEDFNLMEYGQDKADMVYDETGLNILVDDNLAVRDEWRKHGENFKAINAARGFIKELYGLVG